MTTAAGIRSQFQQELGAVSIQIVQLQDRARELRMAINTCTEIERQDEEAAKAKRDKTEVQ